MELTVTAPVHVQRRSHPGVYGQVPPCVRVVVWGHEPALWLPSMRGPYPVGYAPKDREVRFVEASRC